MIHMTHRFNNPSGDSYRSLLTLLAQNMSTPNAELHVKSKLVAGEPVEHVKMFVDENLQKRFDNLYKQLEFVSTAFDSFEDLVVEYVRQSHMEPLASTTRDGQHMLCWLATNRQLTPRQTDVVSCQRSRHEVELLARSKRFEYVQFHNLDRSSGRRIATDAHIHLNPIRSWTRFLTSELLEDEVEPPVDVVFFPDQGQIATAAMDADGHKLFDYLDRTQPCTVREWAEAAGLQDDELVVSLCVELVDMGLATVS